jgi:hypothetical protein
MQPISTLKNTKGIQIVKKPHSYLQEKKNCTAIINAYLFTDFQQKFLCIFWEPNENYKKAVGYRPCYQC